MGQTPFSLKPPPPSPLSNSNLMGNILLLLWVTPINGDEFPYLHTPQLLFLLSCPKPKAIFYPNQNGTRCLHTSRLLSVVRSWHCLLSRHQPHTSMEVWSSKASSRAPERLWQDLGIFQVTGWSSVEANKIGGTPARSRTMLAGHQEGLQANTNSSHLLSPRLSEDRSNLRSWEMFYRGREKRRARHSDGQAPLLPVETLWRN